MVTKGCLAASKLGQQSGSDTHRAVCAYKDLLVSDLMHFIVYKLYPIHSVELLARFLPLESEAVREMIRTRMSTKPLILGSVIVVTW